MARGRQHSVMEKLFEPQRAQGWTDSGERGFAHRRLKPLLKAGVSLRDKEWDEHILGQNPPEEPGVLHVFSIFIIRLLAPDAHPKEVFGLLSLVDHL